VNGLNKTFYSGLLWITLDCSGSLRRSVDKGGRQSLRQSWQFWWRIYPPGSWTRYTVTTLENIEDSCGPGCYKAATGCYKPLQLAAFLKPATDKTADKVTECYKPLQLATKGSGGLTSFVPGLWDYGGLARAATKVSPFPPGGGI